MPNSGQEDEIKKILKMAGEPFSEKEIAKQMGKSQPDIFVALQRLVAMNEIGQSPEERPVLYSLLENSSEAGEKPTSNEKRIDAGSGLSEEEPDKVILLNKPFLGNWLDNQGNIGHEIIDYLLTDNEEHYVYNLPWGVCPDDIWVEGTTGLERTSEEKYVAKYMVLTGPEKKNVTDDEKNKANGKKFSFDILFVIELEEKLHRFHTSDVEKEMKERRKAVKAIIGKREIKYNGKYLDEVYGNDGSLLVTFKASRIYKANTRLHIGVDYDFRHNKGYLRNDTNKADYDEVLKRIEDALKTGNLSEYKLKEVTSVAKSNSSKIYHTFMDLTGFVGKEEAYTNMLANLLDFTEYGEHKIFKEFCEEFNSQGMEFDKSQDYKVSKESKICEGRMDICADSPKQRVIIENKVFSGLNGVRKEDGKTQLSIYYDWGKEAGDGSKTNREKPLCFVTVPDFHKDEILHEIDEKEKDPIVKSAYQIITYGQIADFIEKRKSRFAGYRYQIILDQIIQAFRNYSLSEQDKYAGMFLEATTN